jgi:FkbM family methyltransferase
LKIFFIVPYLSTGGMPEYLKNKIEKIKDDSDIWIFEKNREFEYDTIRKRIEKLVGDHRIITWGKKPEEILIQSIKTINPDVIHFEEPCESFLTHSLLDVIFSPNRTYKIFETLHDSSVRAEEKLYLPDKFIVVSPWQVKQLQFLDVPVEVLEHQLPKRTERDYLGSRTKLGFDSSKKHVIQIGIFTPRKNQKETVAYAKLLPDVQFHFIGTLADNFKWYWEPIIKDLPTNCKIWNERDDVDVFYQAADLVIFPSLSLFNDKETSPLVIKEAISWNSPLLLRNLDVYVDMYQESNSIIFMQEDFSKNLELISNILESKPKMNNTEIFSFSYDPSDNKISFWYNQEEILGNLWVSIKDRDSNCCIHAFEIRAGIDKSWWCIPIPKPYFNFQDDKNFSGFKIEFYQNKTDATPLLIYEIELKPRIVKKQIPSSTHVNFDPIFVNYTQFFVEDIYKSFFAGSRIFSAIDIGANVGLFTEWVLDRFGSDTKIVSIEPNRSAASAFKNMHSGKSNIILEEVAIWSETGKEIEMLINPENTLISSLEGSGSGYSESQKVYTKTLLDVMKDNSMDQVDLLKIDVEGAEYEIFESISSDDLKRFKHLLIEFHNNHGGRINQIIEKIKSANFEIDLRDDDTRFKANLESERGTIFATIIK